jgi:hypothetical protein
LGKGTRVRFAKKLKNNGINNAAIKLKLKMNNDMQYKCCDARNDAIKTNVAIKIKNKLNEVK